MALYYKRKYCIVGMETLYVAQIATEPYVGVQELLYSTGFSAHVSYQIYV